MHDSRLAKSPFRLVTAWAFTCGVALAQAVPPAPAAEQSTPSPSASAPPVAPSSAAPGAAPVSTAVPPQAPTAVPAAPPPATEPPPTTGSDRGRGARTQVSFAARATGASAASSREEQENEGVGEPTSRKERGSELSIELGGALQFTTHFPEDSQRRSVEEAVDSALGLGTWLYPKSSWAIGLSFERIGLGKDHYETDSRGQTLNASYLADTLWLGTRFFTSEQRPAFYFGLAAGPALPRARATGTRLTGTDFTMPPQPFQCSESGRLGAALGVSAGAEFDIGEDWSFLSEARGVGHFIGSSSEPFDGCAPGSGMALSGSLRIGLAYRFRI